MPAPIFRPLPQRMRQDFGFDITRPWAVGILANFPAIDPIDDTMPAPDSKPPQFDDAERQRRINEVMMARMLTKQHASLEDVLSAVTVLTDEVRRLRDAIEPLASGLILGAEATAEFARITRGRP